MLNFQQTEKNMKNYLEILSSCPLFSDISGDDMKRMLRCLDARVDSYDKKYTIFREGDPARLIGIMLSGSAQISRTDYFGNRSIIGNVGAGEVFGEAFACAGEGFMPVSVTAMEPCEIMFIDCSHILHTCKNGCAFHHRLIYNLMKNLAGKILDLHRKVEITSKRTTREKLMEYLTGCALSAGSNSFDIPFDRQELADYLEVERSGLSAEIGKLRDEGVLESRRSHFKLL